MKKIKKGFTLAEALIALLIASLLIAAMLPVITKRHRKVENHGKWECTYIPGTGYVSREYKNGVPTEWDRGMVAGIDIVSDGCLFTPPPNAEDFRITVVGGGGGGAGGMGGKFIEVINATSSGAYVATAERGGTYYFKLQGAGGAGGGMGCGTPEAYSPYVYKRAVDNYFDGGHTYTGSWSSTGPVGSNPGAVYVKDPNFDYSVLYSNDSSAISKYLKNSSMSYCFSEYGWKEWDFSNPDNCWNLPGQGAYAGRTIEKSVDLQQGQSIYVYVGKGGTPGMETLNNKVVGSAGTAGEESYASTGDLAAGTSPGYYRYLTIPSYKSVPVRDCKLVVYEYSYDCSERDYRSCNDYATDLVVSGSGSDFWCTTDECRSTCTSLNSSDFL